VSDPHDDHPEDCTGFDQIHKDNLLTVATDVKNNACKDLEVDFV
jgi:hypothetical protein